MKIHYTYNALTANPKDFIDQLPNLVTTWTIIPRIVSVTRSPGEQVPESNR